MWFLDLLLLRGVQMPRVAARCPADVDDQDWEGGRDLASMNSSSVQ
jgi:hypothetical protein